MITESIASLTRAFDLTSGRLLRVACLILLSAAASFPATAQDSVPKLVNYQGKLVQPSGQPVTDGAYRLRFTLHSKADAAQAGDTLVWGSDYQVTVMGGLFNVVLGAAGGTEVATAAVRDIGFAFTSPDRFLQMEILNAAGAPQSPRQIILPRQQILSTPYALNGVPTGTVVPFAGPANAVPTGWTLCDGQPRDGTKVEFKSLFTLLGLTYGGSGTSFLVPDLRGRVALGAGAGANLTARSIGQSFGQEGVSLEVRHLPDHEHGLDLYTQNDGQHQHTFPVGEGDGGARNMAADGDANPRAKNVGTHLNEGNHQHRIIGNTLGDRLNDNTMRGESFSILQPGLVLNYIIKL